MENYETNNIGSVRSDYDRSGFVSWTKVSVLLLLRRAVRFLAVLVGIACFTLLYAPVRADDTYTPYYSDGAVVGTFDNGEATASQQHQASIRNIQFTDGSCVKKLEFPGLSYAGTPTDELRVTVYSRSSAFSTGDIVADWPLTTTLVTSSTISGASIIAGNTSTTLPNCFTTTGSYYYGILLERTGAESDANFYKIGYNNGAGTNLAIFSLGWNDASPSPKRGSLIAYGFLPASYSVILTSPADQTNTNEFTKWTASVNSYTTTTVRIIYSDAFGAFNVDTRSVGTWSPGVYTSVTIDKANPLHKGGWQAKAQLLSSSSVILAESNWNSFFIVAADYGSTIASTTAMLQGGLFDLENCPSFTSTTQVFWAFDIPWLYEDSVESALCNTQNSIKSLGNIIFSNVLLMSSSTMQLIKGNFPVSVFYGINDAFDSVACPTSTAPIVIPGPQGASSTLLLVGEDTIQTAVGSLGIDFRDFTDKLMWAALFVALFVVAVLVVVAMKQ